MSETVIDFQNLTDQRPVRRKVPKPIPYDELQKIADEAMHLQKSVTMIEAEAKSVAKGFSDRIKVRRMRLDGLVQVYESKTREEEIDCVVGYDWEDTTDIVDERSGKVTPAPLGKKYFASTSDGQLYGPEPITEDDKQLHLKSKTGQWVVPTPAKLEARAEMIVGIDRGHEDETAVVFLRYNQETQVHEAMATLHFTGEENNAENIAKHVVEKAIELRNIKPQFKDAEIRSEDAELISLISGYVAEAVSLDEEMDWMRDARVMTPFGDTPADEVIEAEIVEEEEPSAADQAAADPSSLPIKEKKRKNKAPSPKKGRRMKKSDSDSANA